MGKRLLHHSLGSLVVAAAAVWLAAGSLAAQSKYVPPRAADGHPDLTGVYDAATMTPIERSAEYGGRLVLTPAEVASIERHQQERTAAGAEPSQADRTAPPVGGDRTATNSYLEQVFRAGGGVVGGYNLFWISPGTQLATVDGQKRSSIVVDPADGRVPPIKPEARRRNAELLAHRVNPDAAEGASFNPPGAYDDPEARPLAERCLLGFSSTSGPPTLPNYWYNNLKQIVQTHDTVLILNEMVHDARVIRMGAQHLPSTIRKWMGDSVGHWEGDTLVVDTTNFTDQTQFRGASEHLHVVERFTRTEEHAIVYRFTVDDFIAEHRDEIIRRCRAKVATRSVPPPTEAEIDHGVPLFLDQLVDALRLGLSSSPEIGSSAVLHGHDLLRQGFTVSQVVHDYGDVCQSITELAMETNAPISTDDFRRVERMPGQRHRGRGHPIRARTQSVHHRRRHRSRERAARILCA